MASYLETSNDPFFQLSLPRSHDFNFLSPTIESRSRYVALPCVVAKFGDLKKSWKN